MTETARHPNSPLVGFVETYEREFAYVHRLVRRLGVRPSVCEDVVHDVFTAAYRRWNTFDSARPVRPWLSGITTRIVLDHQRKHATHREQAVATPPEVSSGTGPADALERRQGLSLAQRIIDELEVERRGVFVLHELEGATMPEIAEIFEIPLNTAYSRLRLARRDFEAAARLLTQERGR